MISIDIGEDITISPTTFRDNPVEKLPEPREDEARTSLIDEPGFTPMTVPPSLTNEREVRRALEDAPSPHTAPRCILGGAPDRGIDSHVRRIRA